MTTVYPGPDPNAQVQPGQVVYQQQLQPTVIHTAAPIVQPGATVVAGGGGQTVIVTQQPQPMIPYSFDQAAPVNCICHSCRQQIKSARLYQLGMISVVSGVVLGIVGLCWLPFFMNELKDVVHVCPNCKAQLGVHKRLG